MKKRSLFALITILVLVVLALVGCGQAQSSGTDEGQSQGGEQLPTEDICVTFLDVGKGDAIVIQAGDSAVLIDTGYEDTAGHIVSYLRSQGVKRLSGIIITHYDKDHVGGIRTLGKTFSIDMVYLPGYKGSDGNYRTLMRAVEELPISWQHVTEELSLQLGEAQLTLFPSSLAYFKSGSGGEGNDNDLSLVATLVCGRDSYLFTGDLEKRGISSFLEGSHGQFDVIKMPHHGQKNGQTDELIESVQPKIAVITDSTDEPADDKTLSLLKEDGIDTYRSSTDGNIVIESNGSGSYEVTTSN